jgi:putative endonuclease
VYVLECDDQTLYTGITTDLKRRTEQHNSSLQGSKYTRGRRPVKMVYSCEVPNKSEAQKEEYRIRKLTKKEKIKLIIKGNKERAQ